MTPELTIDQKDCMQELMNISYGATTAVISQILNAFATLHIPKIDIITIDELKDKFKLLFGDNSNLCMTTQVFKGVFEGETIFVLNEDSAKNIAKYIDVYADDEELCDTILEITNIVTSATIKNLSNLLKTDVFLMSPEIIMGNQDNILNEKHKGFELVIIINTVLEFKEQNIVGKLIILMIDQSFEWLKIRLDKIVEDLN
jgi:chemotaxis protein CheC